MDDDDEITYTLLEGDGLKLTEDGWRQEHYRRVDGDGILCMICGEHFLPGEHWHDLY